MYKCGTGEEEEKVKRNCDEIEDCLDMWCLIIAQNRWAVESSKNLQTLPTQDIDLDSGPYFLLFSTIARKFMGLYGLQSTITTNYSCCVKTICCRSEKSDLGAGTCVGHTPNS